MMTFHTICTKVLLTSIIKTTSVFTCDELPIRYDPEGWNIQLVDPSNISLIEMKVKKDKFDTYETSESGEAVISIKKLDEALSYMPDENMVDMKVDEEKAILVCGKVRRTIRLIQDQDIRVKQMPNLTQTCVVNINTAEMNRIASKTNSSKLFSSDAIMFKCDATGFHMRIDAEDKTDSVQYDDEEITSPDKEEYTATYDLEYVTSALAALPQNIKLSMGTNYPIKIETSAPFEITYVLAPRIEEE